VTERPARPQRSESKEVVELKQIKASQPELASAVDLQLELMEVQRRVQARVPLPWIQPDRAWLESEQRAGRPAVRFGDIPLEWSDFRLSLRQTADILHRHEALDTADYDRILALSRDGHALEPLVIGWYAATSRRPDPATPPPIDSPAGLDQVLVLALRPFLARCAEALLPRPEFAAWRYGHCPICGWEPDFAVILPSAERRLICGRCTAQWTFDAVACPFCGNDDRSRITSLATRDGRYRVYACDACKRYLKAYDARQASRAVMVAVDSIATLPLDAAVMQRGYTA
jgi:hypothetical protein